MRGGAIAQRYAKALFGLGQERGDMPVLLGELDTLTDLVLGDAQLGRVLFTPLHPRAERRGVLGELVEQLELSKELQVFSMLLVDQNRTGYLPAIRDVLRELVEQAAGRVTAQLISARPLAQDEVERLREALSQRVNAEVKLELDVDESLIGGVIARIGDLMLDGSVRTQLDSLSMNLRRGAI